MASHVSKDDIDSEIQRDWNVDRFHWMNYEEYMSLTDLQANCGNYAFKLTALSNCLEMKTSLVK